MIGDSCACQVLTVRLFEWRIFSLPLSISLWSHFCSAASVSSYHNPHSPSFILSLHLRCEHVLKCTCQPFNYQLCTLPSPSLCRSSSSSSPFSSLRLWTRWLLTWMWRSAAFLWCPGTVRRTAAWTSCRRTARWHSSSPPREKAATTSTRRSPTASSGPLPLWLRHTHCPAPPLTSGGSCTTTAAPRWWCSTSSTSPTLPG